MSSTRPTVFTEVVSLSPKKVGALASVPKKMRISDLHEELGRRELDTKGKKGELVARLEKTSVLDWFREFDSLDTKTLDELRLMPEQHLGAPPTIDTPIFSPGKERWGSIDGARTFLRESLVADLQPLRDAAEGRERRQQQDRVVGKFYASSAPTDRAKCKTCRGVIPNPKP